MVAARPLRFQAPAMMALMARYCEKHRHAWPVADGRGKNPLCPVAPPTETEPCPIRSVDTIAQVNALGEELHERDREPDDDSAE